MNDSEFPKKTVADSIKKGNGRKRETRTRYDVRMEYKTGIYVFCPFSARKREIGETGLNKANQYFGNRWMMGGRAKKKEETNKRL